MWNTLLQHDLATLPQLWYTIWHHRQSAEFSTIVRAPNRDLLETPRLIPDSIPNSEAFEDLNSGTLQPFSLSSLCNLRLYVDYADAKSTAVEPIC